MLCFVDRVLRINKHIAPPKKKKLSGCFPKIVLYRFMYIAPPSGVPLPNVNLPFKWILRRFEVSF